MPTGKLAGPSFAIATASLKKQGCKDFKKGSPCYLKRGQWAEKVAASLRKRSR